MAKTFRTAVIIEGDSKDGVRAVRATESSLQKLEKQEDRTARRTAALSKSFRGLKVGAATLTAGIGASTVALSRMVAQQAATVRETANMADAIGTSTASLQELGYAGQQVGIGLDKTSDIVKDLSEKLGDAALTGGGELADVLDELNLSAEQLQKLSPVDQLTAISRAIEDLPRAQQITVLESIADDASRLLPLLRDGARGLNQYAEEAREFGISLTKIEVDKLVDADKQIKRLEGSFVGLRNEVALNTVPAITSLTETLNDPQVRDGLSNLASGLVTLADYAATLTSKFSALGTAIGETFGQMAAGADEPIQRIDDKIASLQKRLKGLSNDQVFGQLGAAGIPGADTGPATGAAADKIRQQIAELKRSRQSLQDLRQNSSGRPENKNTPQSLAPINVTSDPLPRRQPAASPDTLKRESVDVPDRIDISTQGERDRSALAQIREDLKSQETLINESYARRLAIVRRSVTNQQEAKRLATGLEEQRLSKLEGLNDQTYSQISSFANRARENIQDQLGDTLQQTLSGNFDGILESWVNTLQQMAAQAAAANLNDALFGKQGGDSGGLLGIAASAIGGYFGGSAGATAAGGVAGNLTSSGGGDSALSLGALSGISGARASGGPVSAGKSYLVGEHGPEIKTFAQSGTIIPNHAIQASANQPTNLNVQIISQGGPLKEQKRERSRGADGSETIKIYVRNALNDMVGNGEMDEVFQPYDLGRQQTVT